MKLICAGILGLVLVGCAANPTMDSELPRHDWSESPDFDELRQAWGWSGSFRANCESGRPLSEMAEKINREQWSEAASIGKSWLRQCPVDMRAHYFMGISLAELGETEDSRNHFRWTEGLMDSVVASGDGESPETAYETISIAEGYDALYFFGLEVKSQTLIPGPLLRDLLIATNENGEEFSIYFNPAAHFARLYELFD